MSHLLPVEYFFLPGFATLLVEGKAELRAP